MQKPKKQPNFEDIIKRLEKNCQKQRNDFEDLLEIIADKDKHIEQLQKDNREISFLHLEKLKELSSKISTLNAENLVLKSREIEQKEKKFNLRNWINKFKINK